MSGVVGDLRDIGGGLASRVRWLGTVVARATALPLLVRSAAWLAGAAATVLAWPPELLFGRTGVFLLGVAALPALAPRTPAVSAVALLTVAGWLASTGGHGEAVTPWRLVALASALYLLHSAAALAAHLPYDAIVSPRVLLRWLGRVGLVVAGTAVVAGYALIAGELLRGPAFTAATLVGIAVAVGIAALLARQVDR